MSLVRAWSLPTIGCRRRRRRRTLVDDLSLRFFFLSSSRTNLSLSLSRCSFLLIEMSASPSRNYGIDRSSVRIESNDNNNNNNNKSNICYNNCHRQWVKMSQWHWSAVSGRAELSVLRGSRVTRPDLSGLSLRQNVSCSVVAADIAENMRIAVGRVDKVDN